MELKTTGSFLARLLLTMGVILVACFAAGSRIENIFGRLPPYFVENRGQVSSEVFYYVSGRDSVYFASRGMTLALTSEAGRHWAVALDMVGARRDLKPDAQGRTEAVVSYFKGPRSEWKTGISTYESVIYREAWPGIDLIWSGTAGRLEDTFVVRPGSDPARIRLRYRGATSVKLDETGGLEVKTPVGSFRIERPRAYQESEGKCVEIPAAFALDRKGANPVYSFRLGRYDRNRPLLIDPVVFLYAGYIGGSRDEYGSGVAVDREGNAYVTGDTSSAEGTFPVAVGPDLTYNDGEYDAFVAKVKADGTALLYAGYIGGTDRDEGRDIALDPEGNAYITGRTWSNETSFPVTVGPDLIYHPSPAAFVAKIRSDGTGLLYAGYIGGNDTDGFSVAVDEAGNAYVTGTAYSESSFPATVGPDVTYNGGTWDAFVAKVKADGTGFDYAGYIGGSGNDAGLGIAVDSAGNAYVTGSTGSDETTFPTLVGPQLSFGGDIDAFVAKVKADGSGFVYAGYIGGVGRECEYGGDIAVDSDRNAYVTGETTSDETSFPVTVGPDLTFNGCNGCQDAFLAKVSADGTRFLYAGYIGGDYSQWGSSIAVDGEGSTYVTGRTSSDEASFPVTVGPDLIYGGSMDAFVAKVKADGTGLLYAGYIGGEAADAALGIAVDSEGNAYVVGWTRSLENTFPVLVGPDLTFNGFSCDAFVVKISSPSCTEAAVGIRQVKAVKQPADLDNIDFTWLPDPAANGYNIWYVTTKEDIPQARQSSSPPAIPVGGCAVPSPAPATACTDQGAVSRNAPTSFFYQVRTYCDAANEGP